MQKKYDAIIVGAGVAGLIAAKHLEEYNLDVLVIEKSDRVGGRVKTDVLDGFRLDRGFQVLLTSYPMVKKHLDINALDLQYFTPGALCFNLKQQFKVSDVAREKSAIFSMIFSSVGSVSDKLKLARLRKSILAKNLEEIFDGPDITTMKYLKDIGFSEKIINRFLQPFYSGIFLENQLSTSARMFEFSFKMFAEGRAAIPAKGMEQIPQQLKNKLKKTEFRFNTEVEKVESGNIILKSGENIESEQIIIATDIKHLMPQVSSSQKWNRTSQYYFTSKSSILNKPIIGLQYRENAIVNNVVELSSVSAHYAPSGKKLIQVSLRNSLSESVEEVSQRIKNELTITFGPEVEHWEYLKSYEIEKALPQAENPSNSNDFEQSKVSQGIYLAGDHLLNPSLNAAMQSGEMAAKALVLNHVNDPEKNYLVN